MFNIGAGELVAILTLALVILGPNRLPDAVRTAGRVTGELRRITGDLKQELTRALDDPAPTDDSADVDDLDDDVHDLDDLDDDVEELHDSHAELA